MLRTPNPTARVTGKHKHNYKMQTYYRLNNAQVELNGTIRYDDINWKVIALYDGTHARLESGETRVWKSMEELGIEVLEVPTCWHFNTITCAELAAGDGYAGNVCRNAGESPQFNRFCNLPVWVSRIPNPDGLSVMPYPEGFRVKDGTPQRKLNNHWVPTSRVKFAICGTPYDTATHYEYYGVHLISESVLVSSTRAPKNLTCLVTVDGRRERAFRSSCYKIDGRWYYRYLCWERVDSGGSVVEYGIGDMPDDLIALSPRRCADPSDVYTCDGNGDNYPRDEGQYWNCGWFSNDWLDDNTFVCRDCGERFNNGEGDDDYYCYDCDSGRNCNEDGVRDYCDRSANNLRPEKDVPIKFGIELEVEAIDDRSESISAFNFPDRYCVLKEDGSLGCGGYEIVTRPDCPSVHKRVFGELLARKSVRETTRSWTSGRCGIHIHVSRAPLSKLWVGRMLVLVNSDDMKPIVSKVAGRWNTTYAGIKHKKLTDAHSRDGSRYDALNTTGSNTIEFRIFRGTLDREAFLKNIEFVEAVLAFCKPCTVSNRDVSNPAEFTAFLRKRRKEWPNLWTFLETKGLVAKVSRA